MTDKEILESAIELLESAIGTYKARCTALENKLAEALGVLRDYGVTLHIEDAIKVGGFLRPCPFCGAEPILFTHAQRRNIENDAMVQCDCGVELHGDTDEAVINLWNGKDG